MAKAKKEVKVKAKAIVQGPHEGMVCQELKFCDHNLEEYDYQEGCACCYIHEAGWKAAHKDWDMGCEYGRKEVEIERANGRRAARILDEVFDVLEEATLEERIKIAEILWTMRNSDLLEHVVGPLPISSKETKKDAS